LYALSNAGKGLTGITSGLVSTIVASNGVAVTMLPDSTEYIAGTQDSILSIHTFSFHNGSVAVDNSRHPFPVRFTTAPMFVQLDSLSLLLGTSGGMVYQLNTNGDIISKSSSGTGTVTSITALPTNSLTKPNEYFFTAGDTLYGQSSSAALPVSSNGWLLAAAVSPIGNYIVAAEKNGTTVVSLNQALSQQNYKRILSATGINELAIADIDGDGEKDVLLQSGDALSILNRHGIMLDDFPLHPRNGLEFAGTPLVADFNGDSKPEIVLLTNDGEMWMYDHSGKLLAGFPVQAAMAGKVFPMVYIGTSPSNKIGIAVLSENGSLDAFLTQTTMSSESLLWWQHLANGSHINAEFRSSTFNPVTTEFLPKSHVYNWPNPVYGQSTQIRYYTGEEATITITILDLAGRKITELSGQGTAGMDNEVTWNVSNIHSGVYLARVEARGASRSEVTFIKIAVIK
jgi:hypothetical protein